MLTAAAALCYEAPRLTGPEALTAVLPPIVRVPSAPPYLKPCFNQELESGLLQLGYRICNQKSQKVLLSQHGFDRHFVLSASQYREIGELLHVPAIIQPTVTEFRIAIPPDGQGFRLYMKGYIQEVAAASGKFIARIYFDAVIDSRQLETPASSISDFGEKALTTAVRSSVITAIKAAQPPPTKRQ